MRLDQEVYLTTAIDEVANIASDTIVGSSTPESNPYRQAIANLEWRVIAHQFSSEALAPVVRQDDLILLSLSVVMSIVALIAVAIALRLARPVNRLSAVTNQISQGDLSVRATIDGRDEVSLLAFSFNGMADQLQDTLVGLETRVSERTSELTLAADVGRTLSSERDIDLLLRTAVEQIRTRFDLYYTQIYLLDATGKALVLRAGTGAVGAELLRRSHRLAVGPGSINGMVASDRRAVIVADTQKSGLFRPNALLPETRSEMAVPLLIGQRVLGVLDLQSNRPDALSEENLPAFEVVAGQLAIAVENAALFSEAENARHVLEQQAARLALAGWGEFMDGIVRPERMGFEFENGALVEIGKDEVLTPAAGSDGAKVIVVPLRASGGEIGHFQFERSDASVWTQREVDLVNTVAMQVGQQIDSMRLLAQAEGFRHAAEKASRQLTRQGWEDYLDQQQSLEYVYDQFQVVREPGTQEDDPGIVLTHALTIRQEKIGELAVVGADIEDEQIITLLETVGERLSTHIETLRLGEQTRRALKVTEELFAISRQRGQELKSLNEITEAASRSLNIFEVLQEILDRALSLMQYDAGLVSLVDPSTGRLVLDAYRNLPDGMVARLTEAGLDNTPCDLVYRLRKIVLAPNLRQLPEELSDWKAIMERPLASGFEAYLGVPLESKNQVIGTICMFHKIEYEPNAAQIALMLAIGQQLGVAVDNSYLFAQTESALAQSRQRSEELTSLNEITEAASRSLNIFEVLQEILERALSVDTL